MCLTGSLFSDEWQALVDQSAVPGFQHLEFIVIEIFEQVIHILWLDYFVVPARDNRNSNFMLID